MKRHLRPLPTAQLVSTHAVTAHLQHRRLPTARPVPGASVCFSLVPSLSVWFYCLLCGSALSLLDVRFVSVVFRRVLCVSAALLYKEGLPLLFAVSLFTCPALYNLRPLLALVLFVLRRPPDRDLDSEPTPTLNSPLILDHPALLSIPPSPRPASCP